MQEVLMEDDKMKKTSQNSSEEKSDQTSSKKTSEEKTESHQESVKESSEDNILIPKTLFEELEKKATQSDFYLDHLQRVQAEFENFRKRNVKEKEEFRKFILEDFILELLDVLDNFDRAMASAQSTSDIQNLLLGFKMIHRQLQESLSKKGVSPIEAINQTFDPSKHDAVAFEESKDKPAHLVVEQMSKGYALHGKVIRPSKVKVSKESTVSQDSTPTEP